MAAKVATGQEYGPNDFSSGTAPGQAVHLLRSLGFQVVKMGSPEQAPTTTRPRKSPVASPVRPTVPGDPSSLTAPNRVYGRAEVLTRPCPVPKERGLYAWYFREVPPGVPIDGCVRHEGLTLLYVGICPSRPGPRTLRDRVRDHFRGRGSTSTLRRTLGILLGIPLRPVRSGGQMDFADRETELSDWMHENAFVTWITHPEPWVPEPDLIRSLSVPLNLDGNAKHPFYTKLKAMRAAALAGARGLPVVR